MAGWLTRTNWTDGDMPNGQDFSNIGLDIRTWGGAVDAANNALNNLSLMRLNPAALPSVPSAGSFVYDTADSNLKFYNGSGWFVVGGANAGTIWRTGSGAPGGGGGILGDLYLNSANGDVYGPKTGGGWGSVTLSLKGAQGIQGNTGSQGIQGNTGSQGIQGNTGYSPLYIVAAGAPAGGTGNNGDMYINSTTSDVYGPKAAGVWGAIVCNIKGIQGIQGNTGNTGSTGNPGYSPLYIVGAGAPAGGTGNNGDMYLNSATSDVYGPKAAGVWGGIVANIKGATGNTGSTGTNAAWLSGAGVPGSGLGNNGDMYLNSTTGDVYGPKSGGAWGGAVKNIVGPPGSGMTDPGSNGIMKRTALNTSAVATPADLEAALTFTDVVTGNVSTTAHGHMIKLPNNANQFLGGTGTWGAIPIAAHTAGDYSSILTSGSYSINISGSAAAPTTGASLGASTVPIAAHVAGDYSAKITSGSYSINISGTAAAPTTGASLGASTVPIASLVAGDFSSKITSGTYSISVSGNQAIADIVYVIDGGGSAITTGVKGDLKVDFNCTVTAWTLLADQSGSVVVNVWKVAQASYPATSGNKITASAPPTLSSATNATSSTLTGWTTAVSAGDCLRFNVDSATTVTRVVICLKVTKT